MLNQALVQDVIHEALTTGGDFAEVFVEDTFKDNLLLQGGRIDKSLSGRDFGVGIRVYNGFHSAYTYTTDFSREGLLKTARQAAQAINGNGQVNVQPFQHEQAPVIHEINQLPQSVEKARKVNVMKNAADIAGNYHNSISQVRVNLLDEEQNVLIANSDGKFVEDKRVHSRMSIAAIASNEHDMETGFYGPGAVQGFEFYENLDLNHYAKEAARIAVTNLGADPCPSGKFPVIIDNEFGGVIFHEACGHGLEATSVAKGKSAFANKVGEQVAPDIVTYIDDGTIPNEWGSINVDDEGNKPQKNVLIENGILKGYLVDQLNGRIMDTEPTGSGRRESYRYAPTSRMTNTYIAPGESTPEEIIANTEHGIYARYMGGGSVNPATGDYNFAINEAYLVKNGKIDKPVRGATLIGNGPKTLQTVDMVGNNLGHGAGMCGSLSGSIPVNVGQPTLRVSEITVGGRKEDA
ncbi:TldD/PmbA family protein [Alkalibacillus haloalkaliphilus]|uniref:TldD/PmbA family protein n=1 Tax=Alkalibacillus haloalkaliphilus TaxID=94136 RepID=UPI0029358675|nr:TldD/PmbA family protein [Alkalibacillus haloalkaliphilus]MDV2581732.1 TldD/PmbA family protein [Alkalibacillus haloalkaliphilus]